MSKVAVTWKKAQRFLPLTFKVAAPHHTLDVGKMVEVPDGFFPTNPSILRIDEGFLICVRCVNYTLKSARSMTPEFTAGDSFHTANRFFLASSDCTMIRTLPRLDDAFADIEDIKLFKLEGNIYGTGSRIVNRDKNSCCITLAQISPDLSSASFQDIPSPFGLSQEKNWAPFSRYGDLYFLYSYHPLVILRYRFESGTVEFCHPEQANYQPTSLPFLVCGSSPGVETEDGFLFIAHRRSVRLPSMNRAYISRIYHLDWRMSSVVAGPYFVIERAAIQFVNGLAMDDRSVFVSYGNNDNSAHLACFEKGEFFKAVA